jgi:hypothetical protein
VIFRVHRHFSPLQTNNDILYHDITYHCLYL